MEDRDIVNNILCKGDGDAYAQIVARYSGMVYSKALGVVRSEDFAAEITQQAFIRAYLHLSEWQGEAMGLGL